MKRTLFRSFLIFSALFSLVSSSAFGGTKSIVFFDDFSNNKNQWAVENSEGATFEFKNGLYYFAHNRFERSWHAYKTINIDEHRDFEIETSIVKVSGITDNGYGLIWGRKDGVNQFEFQATGDGYVRIKKYVNNVPLRLLGVAQDAGGTGGQRLYQQAEARKKRPFFPFLRERHPRAHHAVRTFHGKCHRIYHLRHPENRRGLFENLAKPPRTTLRQPLARPAGPAFSPTNSTTTSTTGHSRVPRAPSWRCETASMNSDISKKAGGGAFSRKSTWTGAGISRSKQAF